MAITYNINETIHLRDNWNKVVAPAAAGETLTINDTIHLRDVVTHENDDSGGTPVGTLYIQDEIHLRDTITFSITGAGGGSLNINETIHLRDSLTRNVEVGGLYQFINDVIHIYDQVLFTVEATYNYIRNKNISFGDTKNINYKEFSHRFRWTNYNGIAIPDLNYKDLKEPIVREMPAPSFLQFEYANSFLLFTRNSINRFVLTPDVDTGLWRARTDNLIEEFKDLGLMEPKTLVLAGDTLFGLSEKGVWKWNKEGMELISDKIIDLPDAGVYEYIGFYSSIRNQYILHRQERFGQFLQLTSGAIAPNIQGSGSGTTALAQARVVMLNNTQFLVLHYQDSAKSYITKGTINLTNNSITYGTPDTLFGGNEAQYQDIIPMFNGDGFVWNFNTSGQPRKVYAGNALVDPVTFGFAVNSDQSSEDHGHLVKLSETRFALFATGTSYETGTATWGIDNAALVVLDTNQVGWTPSAWEMLDHVYISEGVAVIVYANNGTTIKARFVTDNGDGTLTFGSILDTGITTNWVQALDIKLASSDLIFMAVGETDAIKLAPLVLDRTAKTITIGNIETKAGWIDSGGGHTNLTIANRGSNGFWLFFEDANNSSYLTAMWGAGSATDMTLATSIKTVIQTELTYDLNAQAVVGGKAVLHYSEGGALTDDGFASIWGLDYAAIDSFVYQIDRDKWTRFLGLDISDIPVILSGGSLDENYNLWLDSEKELKKYPGTAYTSVEAVIRTKEFYIEKGAFQRWMVDFEGSSVNVETRVKKMVGGTVVNEEDIKYNVDPNKFRVISLDKQRGYQMSIKIIDANILKGLSFDSKKWGER